MLFELKDVKFRPKISEFFKLGARKFHSLKYRKHFFSEKYKKFFQSVLFIIRTWGWKVRQVALHYSTDILTGQIIDLPF